MSFRMHSYEKCACKFFGMHCYKIIGLKLPWNEYLQKKGGGGLRLCRGKASQWAFDVMRHAPRSENWRSSKALPFLSPEAPASVDTPAVDFFDYVASNT